MGNRHSHTLLMGMQTGTAFLEGILAKLRMHLPFHPAIPLLAVYLQNTTSISMKIHTYKVFLAALFVIAKYWKQPKCPLIRN